MNKKISLKDAISIGIGGMVGGGIFAVLGLAVSLAFQKSFQKMEGQYDLYISNMEMGFLQEA